MSLVTMAEQRELWYYDGEGQPHFRPAGWSPPSPPDEWREPQPRPSRRRARSPSPELDEEDWGGGAPERKRARLDPEYDDPVDGKDARVINEELDHDGVESRSGGQAFVFYFRWTYSVLHGQTLPEFKLNFERIIREMKAFGGSKAKFMFQLEDPANDGSNVHYQGYINLTVKKRKGQLIGHFNRPSMFPGMQIGYASTVGKDRLKAYCIKSDSRIAGPWGDRPIQPPYDGADLPGRPGRPPWWPWQKKVIDSMEEVADDRTIHYVYDRIGKQGKSKVIKHLALLGIARKFGWVEAKNAFYSIQQGGPHKGYIFDLTRTKPKKVCATDIYSMLEDIKNGHIDGSLYENEAVLFNPPHVWVFSNSPPKLDAMSADRFRLYQINDHHDLVPYNPVAANMRAGQVQAQAVEGGA